MLLLPSFIFAQSETRSIGFLQKLEESAGFNLQFFNINPDIGAKRSFTSFSLPLHTNYTYNRYLSFAISFNQGYQSFDGNGIYGVGDLLLSSRLLLNKNITIVGGFTLPTGSKELKPEELSATSAGRIPFINSPLRYGSSGFGFRGGFSYGSQLNSKTAIAAGIKYFYRGEYNPLEFVKDYDPSDELRLSAGIDYGNRESGLIAKTMLSFFTKERVAGNDQSEPGLGFAFQGTGFYQGWKLATTFYKRQKTKLTYGGKFKPPSLVNFKISHGEILNYLPGSSDIKALPYLGFEHTGEGTVVKSANIFLFGLFWQNLQYKEYPLAPYLELNFGSLAGDARILGLELGTNVTFQIY